MLAHSPRRRPGVESTLNMRLVRNTETATNKYRKKGSRYTDQYKICYRIKSSGYFLDKISPKQNALLILELLCLEICDPNSGNKMTSYFKFYTASETQLQVTGVFT